MKRSDMMYKIMGELMNYFPNEHFRDPATSDAHFRRIADSLLDFIEKAGMLPPEREIEIKAPAKTWYYVGHEWEPEESEYEEVCFCGESMETHSNPMSAGHTPTPMKRG